MINRSGFNTPWPQEAVDVLLAMWADNKSADEISKVLPGTTRNSVLGKVHRLKLPLRMKGKIGKERKPDTWNEHKRSRAVKMPKAAKPVKLATVKTNVAPMEVGKNADVLAMAVLSLESHSCRFPMGDTRSPDFHFCGEIRQEGKSYCPFHHRKSFYPHVRRKRITTNELQARAFG